jgi:hypothetical protein
MSSGSGRAKLRLSRASRVALAYNVTPMNSVLFCFPSCNDAPNAGIGRTD